MPIDRGLTVVYQVLVGLAEVVVAEEATVGRQGRRVDGSQHQVALGVYETAFALGVGSPE